MSEKQEETVKTEDSCGVFKDIRFFVSGEVDEKVIDVLKDGGAERLNYFSDYVTHLIVGENPEENDIVDATDVYEVPALTPKWVIMCAALKRLVTTKPYLYSHDQKLFSKYVFCFSNVREDRNYLWSLITYHGGIVQLNFDRNCNFLIAAETDGPKYKKAESLGPELIKIVTPDWVVESVKNLLPADPSLFHPKLINWPKPVKQDSTTAITGFEPEQIEAIEKTEEQAISDSTQALLDKLKQRMPWNQPNTPQTTSPSDPVAPPNVVAPSFLQKNQQPGQSPKLQQPPQQITPQSPVSAGLPAVPKSPSSSLPSSLANQQIPRSIVHHTPNQQMNFQQSQQSHPLSIARMVGQQQPRQSIQQLRGQLSQSQLHQQLLQQRMQLQNQQVIQRTPAGQIPLQQQQVLQQQLVQSQLSQRQILQSQLNQNQISPQVSQNQQQILQNQQLGQTQHLGQLSQQQLAQLQQQHLQLKQQQQLVQNQQIQLSHNQQQGQINQNVTLPNQQHLISNQVLHQQQSHVNQQQNQQTNPQQPTQISQGQNFIQHNVNQHITSSHAQQLLHKQQFVNQQTTSGQQQVSTAQQLVQSQANIMVQQSQQLIGSNFKQNQIVNQDIQQQQNVNQQLNVHALNQQLSTQNLGQQLNQQQLTQQATQQSQLEQLNQELNQQINQQSQINQQIQLKQQSSPPTQQQIGQSPINQQLISQNQLSQQQNQQLCQQQILQNQLNQQQLGQQSQLNQQLVLQQGQLNQISQPNQLNQQINQNHLNSSQNQLNQQNQINQQLLEDIQALNQQLQQQSVGQQNIQQQQQLQRQSLQQLQGLKQQQALQQQQQNLQQGISQGLQQQVITQQTLHQQQQSLNQQTIQQGLNQQNLQGLNQSSLQQQALNQQNLQQQQLNQVVRSQFQQQSPQQQAGGISQQILINQASPQNQPQRAQLGQHLWGQQPGQQIIRHPVSVVQQGAPRVQWTTNQGGAVPQRQFIQLDARTHNQLQKMPPEEQALFVAKLQRQRQQLIKQVQQRGGGGGHILIRGNVPPGLTAQQQVQWLQQQAKQQGIVLPPSIQQQQQPVGSGGSPVATPLAGQLPPQQPVPGAPGLSPINQGPPQPPPPQFAAANADQNQQQQLQLRQYRLQQLQLQREQAQKNHLSQQQGGITQQAVVRPMNQQHLADSTTNPQVGDASMHPLVVNPKTKTALANMLSIKLQSGGSSMGVQRPDAITEPSAAGTLRLMTAQHNAALNSKPQEIIALQRRTISGPNGEIIKTQQSPLSAASEPPKLQFTQKPSLPLQHRPGPFYGHNPNLKLPPDLFLLGCIFVVVEMENFLEENVPGWRQKIEKHGGEIEKQYCSRVTHVLCETQRHGVVMQALRDCKRCVTIVWLNDVMQRKQVLPPWTALHLPNIYLDTAPASKHLISITGFEGNDRNRIKQMIKITGAKCTTYFSKHNTLLISAKSDCKKCQHAKKWQIPVVNVQWLTDIMLGHFTAMNQMENQIYQQFPNPPNFSFDPKLVPNLMMAWKAPINISQESYERVKRSASPVMLPKKYKKPKTETTDENGNISQEQVSNSTHKILFSMFPHDNELAKMVREIGGSVVKDHTNFTHLVMPYLARSNKLFFAIAKEAHVVSEQWLKDSHDAKKFLPETSYSLSTKEFNIMYKCDFDQTLQTRNRCKLLEGKFFYVTPSVVPSKKVVSELIQSCGGIVERIRRSSAQIEATSINSPYSYFIITHENDLHLVADLLKNKKDKMKIVCNVELIFSAILKQTFEVEPYAVCVL